MIDTNEKIENYVSRTISIPVKYVDVKVNAKKEDISNLMHKLIMDDKYRIGFNKNPEESLKKIGIDINKDKLKEIGLSPISRMVKDFYPAPQDVSLALIIVGVIIGIISPSQPLNK